MNNLKTMKERVQEYLSYRRSLGFKHLIDGQQLLRFANYVDSKNYYGPITEQIAVEWAKSSKKSSRLTWAGRLEIVSRLAKHLCIVEPGTQIPPKGLFGQSRRRIKPYIFTLEEIQKILQEVKNLIPKNSFRQITFIYLFTLLYVTGLRISEALNLLINDVDLESGILHIRQTKFNKSRLVPMDNSTVTALSNYYKQREHYVLNATSSTFFVLDNGEPVKLRAAEYAFSRIRNSLGMGATLNGRIPRLYDFRHTFVCHRLLSWYEQGANIHQMLPYLSTYLGHVKVSDTYWYITGIPELMNISAQLFNSTVL